MHLSSNFEIVDVAGEYIAVPVGEAVMTFHGVVALTDATAFILRKMTEPKSTSELVGLLTAEYDVEAINAEQDINQIIPKLLEIGIIEEE